MNREPLYFSEDSHLADLFREAEEMRGRRLNVLQSLVVIVAGLGVITFLVWGVARAIDKGF